MCGIFGIDGSSEAANLTYLGLYALQHRGQESAGIVSWDGERLHVERGMGLVADIFRASTMKRLPGTRAIGHIRYSTAGHSVINNAQPIVVETAWGPLGDRAQRQPGQRRRDPRSPRARRARSSRPPATPR